MSDPAVITHEQLTARLKDLSAKKAKALEAMEHHAAQHQSLKQQLFAIEGALALCMDLIREAVQTSSEAGTEQQH
jgi:hypothetical protein